MKKIQAICVLLTSFIVFAACSSDKTNDSGKTENSETTSTYSVLVYGLSDSTVSGCSIEKYDFADSEAYANTSMPEKMSIQVGDVRLDGQLASVNYMDYNHYPTYMYLTDGRTDGLRGGFRVNPAGMLTFYIVFGIPDTENVASQDECVQIAKDFLSEIVDISPYYLDIRDEENSYTIWFVKDVDDITTTDWACVEVKKSGYVYGYKASMLGEIPADLHSNFDMEKVEAAVYEKLDQVYATAKTKYDRVEYEEPSVKLTVLKDGKTALLYDIVVEFIDDLEDGRTAQTSDVISLIVTE